MDYQARYEKLKQENETLRVRLAAATDEIGALKANADGASPIQIAQWLQSKAERQRVALDRLNKRVVAQRFVLRNIERLGRGLTKEERSEAYELEGRSDDEAKTIESSLALAGYSS